MKESEVPAATAPDSPVATCSAPFRPSPNLVLRRSLPFICAIALFPASGCISSRLVKKTAKAHWEYDYQEGCHRLVEGKPGYYALLPLTVVADVATAPVQLFLFTDSSGTAHVHGWPIPLP